MRIVVGIGNPGRKYLKTRHNAGFLALDMFADKYGFSFQPAKGDFYFVKGQFDTVPFMLVKPTTYVNRTGMAVEDILHVTEGSPEEMLVVYDDVNLLSGTVRVKPKGSDGGHNGIYSIIYHLQTENFPRIRLGIGSDFDKGDMADYVLSRFAEDEQDLIVDAFTKSTILIKAFIDGGTKKMLDENSRLLRDENNPKKTPNDGGIDG